MSERWPGGIVRSTPVTPAGPFQNGAASGVWSLADAAYWTKQGLWPLAGNEQLVVEDVFSTYLYTGNGASSQTITNGINLTGKGGMVWIKSRSTTGENDVWDTSRGANNLLVTNGTDGQGSGWASYFGFNSSGFSLTGNDGSTYSPNRSGVTYASWTFREAPKFFDVVTYTGNGTSQTVSHNLGVTPGCIIVKRTDDVANWAVWHRGFSNPATSYAWLNLTDAASTSASIWNNTAPTSTGFSVGGATATNASGGTYVAYLYAHDTASDGIIQCGSYAGTGVAGQIATLGWEPQWVMIKATNTATDWQMYDTMRGMTTLSDGTVRLNANTSGAESGPFGGATSIFPTATGFGAGGGISGANQGGGNYIYVAIRRGPMRTPTLGTSVFAPVAWTGTGGTATIPAGFTVDLAISKTRSTSNPPSWFDRLRGPLNYLGSSNTDAESSLAASLTGFDNNTGVIVGADTSGGVINYSSRTFADWMFRRAPGFFDEVCYTGTGAAGQTFAHNLGVTPELMIVKRRNAAGQDWRVWAAAVNGGNARAFLNDPAGFFLYDNGTIWGNGSSYIAPTATQFTVSSSASVGASGGTFVAYLFASCLGVSKVGSYTGTGALQTINCAFTTGARFVLIKRTDSTGDWFVWDSARGISSGNDPYLLLNTTATEVTGTNYVDTDTTGFKVTAAAPAGINASGGSYIFLAIA